MAANASASGSTDAGHTIGPYVLTKEIGKGSFAVVFQGKLRHAESSSTSSTGRPVSSKVAIKIVTRRKLTTKLLENLEGEISILRTARHANIVELIDCLKTSSHIYLVMQYCRMGDLSNYIRSRHRSGSKEVRKPSSLADEEADAVYPHPHDGGLNAVVIRSFLSQLAAAIRFMRGKNIVHRDIKPQNLLLQEPEADLIAAGHPALIPQVKVADFGFARHLEAASLAETLCGSPLYMAPEILRYEKYDAKADLWSVGAVLYEMCVGKPPFRAANHVELLRRIEKGEDRIKFPDERSDESLRRASKDGEEQPRPHVVDDDLKALIRLLLKRKPVERMTFENFFDSDIIIQGRKQLLPKSSSSSLSSSSTNLVATRAAPAIPSSSRGGSSQDLARLNAPPVKSAHDSSTVPPQLQEAHAPPGKRSYFKSKYVVGDSSKDAVPKEMSGNPAATQRAEKKMVAPSADAGDASSLEDNVLETPGSSVSHLPLAEGGAAEAPARTTARERRDTSTAANPSVASEAKSRTQKSMLDEDKGYVIVEKRNIAMNALTSDMSSAKIAGNEQTSRGPWDALSVVRRPSRLGRLASGLGAGTMAAVGINTSPVAITSPSNSPRQQMRPPSTPSSQVATSSSPVSQVSITPPPANAPFAIPLSARRPSFARRRSSQGGNDSSLTRLTSPSQQQVALVPSSAPAGTTSGDIGSLLSFSSSGPPIAISSNSSSALSRAISMASVRLFGVPTGMSLRSASVRRSLRLGLGAGNTAFSSSPGVQVGDLHPNDPAEQNLLTLLQDYGQKSFVLSEFADSKLGVHFSEGPHQGNYLDGGRYGSSSGISHTQTPPLTAQRLTTNTATSNSLTGSSEVAASEALLLYLRSLSFLQRGMDATKDFIEVRSSRHSRPHQPSVEIQDSFQWLRAKFVDGLDRATFARSNASEEMPDSTQAIDRMIFDKALEIARGAAMEQMQTHRDANEQSWNMEKCLLAYETASSMLMALLDPGEEAMALSETFNSTVEKFVKSIQRLMTSMQQKYQAAQQSPPA